MHIFAGQYDVAINLTNAMYYHQLHRPKSAQYHQVIFFSDAVDSTVFEMRLGQEKLQELGVCTHSKGDSLTMEEDGDNSNFHLFGAQNDPIIWASEAFISYTSKKSCNESSNVNPVDTYYTNIWKPTFWTILAQIGTKKGVRKYGPHGPFFTYAWKYPQCVIKPRFRDPY